MMVPVTVPGSVVLTKPGISPGVVTDALLGY